MRAFSNSSTLNASGAKLALAPALTPGGKIAAAAFFTGFATHPRALAQGLVTLADITATRYFQFAPADLRDPVLSAHGDCLRAEVFSADNSVYARLDILQAGLDGGEIGFGTTNVDIGQRMRQLLSMVRDTDLFHLEVSAAGLRAATPESFAKERPVNMPDRWVRALGNAAAQHRVLAEKFSLEAAGARAFIASLPAATGTGKSGWLIPTPTGVRLGQRPMGPAVWVAGLHRFSALKRLLTLVSGITFYGVDTPDQDSPVAVGVDLPGARLFLAVTPQPYRGYSGEGALLEALATPAELDALALVGAALAFESHLDLASLAAKTGVPPAAVPGAVANLAALGKVGWDFAAGCYFHRELPTDPDRIERDNPRLVRARKIIDSLAANPGAIREVPGLPQTFEVDGGNGVHRVVASAAGMKCTCPWFLRHGEGRGACAHVLAVQIWQESLSARG